MGIRSREWAHGQKYLPKQPEAADLDVSSGWDTKLKRRGKTCLLMGADILAPEGSIHPRSAYKTNWRSEKDYLY